MSKILIVEDDPYVRKFYERLFSHEQYEVEIAGDGEEGLQKAKSFQPNLILLDIIMPKMDGLQVLQKLKTDPETKEMDVVMLTNLSDSETVKVATRAGASGFIIKSQADPERLEALVEQYLHQQPSAKGVIS